MDQPNVIDVSDAWAANVAKQEASHTAKRNGAKPVVFAAPVVKEAEEVIEEVVAKPVVPIVKAPE